jgi:hypothetical protein
MRYNSAIVITGCSNGGVTVMLHMYTVPKMDIISFYSGSHHLDIMIAIVMCAMHMMRGCLNEICDILAHFSFLSLILPIVIGTHSTLAR